MTTAALGLALGKLCLVLFVLALAVILQEALRVQHQCLEKSLWAAADTQAWLRRYDGCFAFVAVTLQTIHAVKVMRLLEVRRVQGVRGGHPWFVPRHGAIIHTLNVLTLCPVAALLLLPTRWYDRHRHSLVLLSRLMRLAVYAAVLAEATGGSPSMIHVFFADDMAKLATTPDWAIVLRAVLLYSGAQHAIFQSILCLLPARYSVVPQFISACVMSYIIAPNAAVLLLGHPKARTAALRLCDLATGCLQSVLFWPFELECSQHVVEGLFCCIGVVGGCMVPMLLFSAVEYRAKVDFVMRAKAMAVASHAAGAPAASGAGQAALPASGHQTTEDDGERERVRELLRSGNSAIGTPAAWWCFAQLAAVARLFAGALILMLERLAVVVLVPPTHAGGTTATAVAAAAAGGVAGAAANGTQPT